MKILIAGLGSIGRRHLKNLLALGESDILLYRTYHSTLPDDELKEFPVEQDISAALTHKPDAVVISNPTSMHLDIAIPAAEAGCFIFLEKPISHSLAGINELQAALQRGGSQVFVGFQFRFHPGLQLVKRLLSDGSIGRPISARAHWGEYLPHWHPWEDYRRGYSARSDLGGGVLLTLCHPFDYLRWLFGEVDSLWAFTGKLGDLDLEVEDTAEVGLRFTSGILGSLHLDYTQRPPAHYLELIGTNGTIRWDNDTGTVKQYRGADDRWQTFPTPENFERNDLFLSQMGHFLDIVNGVAEPLCTLDDGIRALQLALAAHQSSKQGKLIKNLEELPG